MLEHDILRLKQFTCSTKFLLRGVSLETTLRFRMGRVRQNLEATVSDLLNNLTSLYSGLFAFSYISLRNRCFLDSPFSQID